MIIYDYFLKKFRLSDVDPNNKGGFADEAAIIAAYPVGQEGWQALNYDTDTIWVWDATTAAWVDTNAGGSGGLVSSVAGRIGDVVLSKADVGLANVDNTSDANKPISTDQQTALDLKANKAFAGYGTKATLVDADTVMANNSADSLNPIVVTLLKIWNYIKAKADLVYIPFTQNDLTKEPTGFAEPDDVIVTGDSATRKVTLTGTVNAYWRGVLDATVISGWESPAHGTDTAKAYFLYSTDGSEPTWFEAAWEFDWLLVSYAYYNTDLAEWVYFRETHGFMPHSVRKEFHDTVGSYKESGGDFSDYTLDSTTATDRRPDLSATAQRDEDLGTINPALTSKAYTQSMLISTGISSSSPDQVEIVPVLVANPYYNEFTDPNWVQTLMPADTVQSIWVYSIPMALGTGSQKFRYLFVQGQWVEQSTNSSANRLNQALNRELRRSVGEVSLGNLRDLAPEVLPIGRITITYTGGDWYFSSVSLLTGSALQQQQSPAGNFLSTVAVDDSLEGSGTTGDPLGLSTTNPLQFPVLTTVERDAVAAPVNGMKIFNSTTGVFNKYEAGVWGVDGSAGGGVDIQSVWAFNG